MPISPPSPGVSPKVYHEGLLVPNALGLTYPRMAEPDQIDFATAANAQWGVVDGCGVTISGFTAMVAGGCSIVNGSFVTVAATNVSLGGSGAQDRFDAIVVDNGGRVSILGGAPALDPVFPDVPITATLLAVVFVPTGAATLAGMVIDKRRFVSKALLTKIDTTLPLINNANDLGNHFSVFGDGYIEWEGDTCLYRVAAKTLRVKDHLQTNGNIQAIGSVTAAQVAASGTVTGSNLIMLETPPPSANVPLGSIHQNPVNGSIEVNTATGWKALAVVDGIMPVGTVIQSVEPPSVMEPKGWVLLDGSTVSETIWPNLFTLTAFNPQGTPGSRTLQLPNAMGKVLRGGKTGVGNSGGHDAITLSVDQMPRHRHNVRTAQGGGSGAVTGQTSRSGKHSHVIANSGQHTHQVIDPGHSHNGGEYPAGAFVCLVWGGQNKIDALFNDRNHTYSVESVQWTKPSVTAIQIAEGGSFHGHPVEPDGEHDHSVTFSGIAAHGHVVGEDDVGVGASIDITPTYLTTYTYIRA